MKFRMGLVLAMCAVPGLAVAGDRKAFHGALCQTANGEDVSRGAHGFYALEDLNAVCPLTRDRLQSSSSLGTVYVEFKLFGRAVDCTLRSQREDGNGGTQEDWDSDQATGVTFAQLSFDVDVSSGNEGKYALECFMTAETNLLHILTDESTGAAE
jgi:hypothetical protein